MILDSQHVGPREPACPPDLGDKRTRQHVIQGSVLCAWGHDER